MDQKASCDKFSRFKSYKVWAYTQSCLTLCDPMDCILQSSSVHRMFQPRVLEQVTISFSGDLPDPGIEPTSLHLLQWQADSLPLHHLGSLNCLGSLKWAVPGVDFYIHLSNWACLECITFIDKGYLPLSECADHKCILTLLNLTLLIHSCMYNHK